MDDKYEIIKLIRATGRIEEYLTSEKLAELGLKDDEGEIINLIKATGKIEEYLTPEKLAELGLMDDKYEITELIKATNNPEKYLFNGQDINDSVLKLNMANIIKSTGRIEEYLTSEKLEELGLRNDKYEITELIKATGRVEEYLTPEKLEEVGLRSDWARITELIKATGKIEEYLTPEKLAELGLRYDWDRIIELIKATNNPEKYLFDGQNINDSGLKLNMANIIKSTGRIEEYLTSEKLEELGLRSDWNRITELIKATGKIEEYLTPEKLEKLGLRYDWNRIIELIKATGKIEEYLTPEKLAELGLNYNTNVIKNLIKATGRIEEYLTPEKLEELGLEDKAYAIEELIKATNNPERYLFEGQDINGPRLQLNIANIIKATGKIEEYLTPEKLAELRLNYNTDAIKNLIKATNDPEKYLFEGQDIKDQNIQLDIANIIKATGKIEEYLTLEKLAKLGLKDNDDAIAKLIRATQNPEKYLLEGQDINDPKLRLNMANIYKVCLSQSLTKEDIETVLKFNNETIEALINVDESKQKDAIKILDRLSRSNSAELRRIKEQMALQILEKEPKTYEKTLNSIENIYLTSNIPDVGKLYLVFKELHPNLLGEDTKMQDASVGNIPSLKEATTSEKKNMIFTRLLMSTVESNSRNLRDYIETIEQGNEIFKKIRNGEVKAQNLAKNERETITKYNEILNFVYNQSNKEEKRENTGDIEKDINELAKLFRMDVIEREMPDRLVRLFAHRAEIRSLAQSKKIMEKSREKADERNTEFAKRESINIEEGDFVKGIENTEYFPSMLQRGILAKDFLGGNATSDSTPLDTDVEKVTKAGETLKETLAMLKIANCFTNSDVSNKKLGKIMLVFSKDNFVETRNQNNEVSKENIELLKQDKDKKEVCHNFGTAYGISMGIGSENIKCIIADKYVDKLGLEIALNGFYIPIVDNDGKVVYTKEMYESFREKMQGLSHYGEKHFELDETAKKPEISGIIELVDRSMQDARNKQEKILKTLEEAVIKNGYTLSDGRRIDLKPGFVEFVDTGSTSRGTNMPSDGDFDYMVRMDKALRDNSTEFKNSLREVLRKIRETKR